MKALHAQVAGVGVTRALALVAALVVVLAAAGCTATKVPAPGSFEPRPASELASDAAPGAFDTPTGLTNFRLGRPHEDVRAGALVVRLAELGNGPLDDIEDGPKLEPSEWTTRLSLRIVVRNAGSEPATVTLSPDWLLVHDGKGHHRPPIGGAEDLVVRGLAKRPVSDTGPVKGPHKLEPGGELEVLRSFVVRKDDRTRTLWVAYRLNDDTLVRFRLEPSNPPPF